MLEQRTEAESLEGSVERFGKYDVIGLLGRGGMAEVFLCRRSGLGGFNKEVVVKRILPHRLDDPAFMQMFLEEARLAANLTHPNVVQVFEIDEVHGIPYIAMEYVRGPTLTTLLRQARQQGHIHFGHMAKIVAGVCAGLHHAHSALGPDGQRLGIVHRDVSPQNILISADGVPKILDFGVAKAHGRSVTTEAGTLKGKLRYMAPERLQSGTIDHRADVFSAGIVLGESTTGRSPFGPPELAEYELIRSLLTGHYTRPSEIVPDYPKELEEILLWAIAPDVAQRCPSAEHLQQALEDFVSSGPYASSPRTLAAYMHELVPSKLFSLPIQDNYARSRTPHGGMTGHDSARLPQSGAVRTHTRADSSHGGARPRGLAPDEMTGHTMALADGPLPPVASKKSHAPKWVAAGLVVALSALLAVVSRTSPDLQQQATVAPPVTSETVAAVPSDASARKYLDEAQRLIDQKRFAMAAQMLDKARELKIEEPDLNIRLLSLADVIHTQGGLRAARALLDQGKNDEAIEVAKAVLDSAPESSEALDLIAKARKARAPALAETARPNRAHHERPTGQLFVSSNVPGMVYLDDEPMGRTPIHGKDVPPGRYTLQIRAQGHKPYETHVVVASGKRMTLDATLQDEPYMPRDTSAVHALAAVETPAIKHIPIEPPPAAAPVAPVNTRPSPAPAPVVAAASTAAQPTTSVSTGTARADGKVASAPPAPPRDDSSIVSARPKAQIPPPRLPREYSATGSSDIARVFRIVEGQAVSLAGVSPEFASGVTGALQRAIGNRTATLYPVALYYFIVSEAGRGHDKRTAAGALLSMRDDSPLRAKMSTLPAHEQSL
jgi:serine/threonine protein kinase